MKCYNCKKEPGAVTVPNHRIEFCKKCANEKIVVWKYQPKGLNHCVEDSIYAIGCMLSDATIGETIEITSLYMKRYDFHCLPEFEGF